MTAIASRLPASEDVSQQRVTALLEACGQGDVNRARERAATFPSIANALNAEQLRLLPEAASVAKLPVVRAMLAAGWPIDVLGGDWNASALNHAAMNGDLPMFRFLLDQGANWETRHGFGDTVIGTLSWASINNGAVYRDHFGCLRLLLERGVPVPSPAYDFPEEISDYLDRLRART
jgi:ankyrin repeat protein